MARVKWTGGFSFFISLLSFIVKFFLCCCRVFFCCFVFICAVVCTLIFQEVQTENVSVEREGERENVNSE